MIKRKPLASILLSTCLALSACNMPGASGPESNVMSTAAAQTVQAILSPAVTQVSATLPAAITQPPTAVACEDAAKFTIWTRDNVTYDVKEVNKPLAPGKVFSIAWTLQNTGTCTWNNSYQMVFISGTPLTTVTKFPIIPTSQTVAPDDTINIEIPMSAPDLAGEYNSSFELQNERSEAVITFGIITKVGTISQSLASPGDLKYFYDCTTGSVNINLSWVDKASDEDGYRIYRDGAKLVDVPDGSTTYSDIAPSSGKYTYTVAAFNASGESPSGVKVDTQNCQ